jgi:hypothetical protein
MIWTLVFLLLWMVFRMLLNLPVHDRLAKKSMLHHGTANVVTRVSGKHHG